MAEERRLQAPTPCANNCGFFGSPATHDLCSKCHRDLHLKEPQPSSSPKQSLALAQTLIASPSSSSAASPSSPAVEAVSPNGGGDVPVGEGRSVIIANRCVACRKRVGVMGFTCRCGMVLCGPHRYPELHACRFDFKRLGRDEIARANPVVRAPKLHDKV